ncbi:MAG: hypothetical protein Q8P17_01180 [bacterium]|nr:hypothetical protein [bacterium]
MDTIKKRTLILSGLFLFGAALLRWPDFFGICAQVGTMDGGSVCYLTDFNEVGIPAFAFAEIILVAGILWFLSEATRRRWNRFALVFLVISAIILPLVHPYESGWLSTEPTRPEVVAFLMVAFGVISVPLILISEIFTRWRAQT